jgi:hypothetical protein
MTTNMNVTKIQKFVTIVYQEIIVLLGITHRPVFYLKHNVSETPGISPFVWKDRGKPRKLQWTEILTRDLTNMNLKCPTATCATTPVRDQFHWRQKSNQYKQSICIRKGWIETVHMPQIITLSRVRGSVTNNNGFWTGWLDLLALLLQLQLIITAHN